MSGRLPCLKCDAVEHRCGFCLEHWLELIATWPAEVFALAGVGIQAGARRPEYGPGFADLRCAACSATWVSIIGDLCPWCRASWESLVDHQAALLLTPPDVEVEDVNYDAIMLGWAERIARAVDVEILTDHEARRALRAVISRDSVAA